TLDLSVSGQGNKGDVITVEVTPSDGTLSGSMASASATVADSAPSASVSLDSSSPRTNDILTATATASDADGDAVSLTYVWKVNGSTVQSPYTTRFRSTLDLSVSGQGNKGDVITVEVTPSDGTLSGAAASASATVADS